MRNGPKTIFIILILLAIACQKPSQEISEKAGTGDQIDRSRLTPEFASTYLGGSGHEFCEAIAVDDAGNIYVAGNTRSLDFPTTEGAYNRDTKGKKMLEGDFTPQARLRQHHKDVSIILEYAQNLQQELPASKVHQKVLEKAIAAGDGDLDNSAVIREIRRRGKS